MVEYTRGDILALWGVQESLLQSYRQIYLSSQSILIAAAFLLLEVPNPSTKTSISRALLVLIGIVTLYLWGAGHRRKAVTYVQAQLLEIDSGGNVENLYLNMQHHMNGQLTHTKSLDRFREGILAAKEDVLVGKLLQALPLLFALVWAYIGWAYWLA